MSFLNSDNRGNSDITIESVRAIKEELKTQKSRKLDEVKMELNSQLVEM